MNNDFDRTPEELDGKNIKVENAVDEKTSIFKDKRFKVALVALIVALSLVFSVMTTFTLTKRHYEEMLVKAYLDVLTSGGDELGELDAFFQKYSYYELDSEELIEEALRAYIKATGDRYARYYNAEEYAAVQQERTGVNVGLGVNMEYSKNDGAIRITRVMNGSPAEKSGLKAGDLIVEVTLDDGRRGFVHELGYEESIAALDGEPGDIASFVVKRVGLSSAPSYIEFSIVLDQYLTDTVDYKVSSTDPSVGIIMITKFDLFTPMLFKEAMTELKKSGINKIVFDVRNNLGGDLVSVVAILSYFREEGETLLSVKTRNGTETVYKCQARTYSGDEYKNCEVTSDEIGMYRGLSYAVLINENTASAAELFASNFRDASLGTLIGTTTYGKGIVQTIYPFGKGAVKLTTKSYFPPCGISYDGIGITPTNGECELSDEASAVHRYLRDEMIDNQLQAAIAALNK